MEVAEPVREDAGDHDHEERAGPEEELAEVDAGDPAVDEPREQHRRGDAEHRADAAEQRIRLRLHRRPDEERRLDALAADGDDAERDESRGAARERAVEPALEVVLEMAGVARHPEDHPGDESGGGDREDPADRLLRLRAQPVGAPGEQRPECEGRGDRDRDADPETGEDVAAPDLREVCHEDPDDEPCFEPLAEADEEVREHSGRLSGQAGSGIVIGSLVRLT